MNMLIMIRIITTAYFLAVNVYGFILINYQKKNRNIIKKTEEEPPKELDKKNSTDKNISDGKIFLTGLLGGALGIYLSMFIYKYRLNHFLLMVMMPVFIAISLYLLVCTFSNSIGFFVKQ